MVTCLQPWQTSNFDFTINTHSEKCSKGWRLFSDAYHSFVPSQVQNVCVHRNFHCIYHKIFTCTVGSKKTQCLWLPSELHCVCTYRSNFSVSQQELSAAEQPAPVPISPYYQTYMPKVQELSGLVSFARTIFSCASTTNDNTTMDVTVQCQLCFSVVGGLLSQTTAF